MYNQLYMCAAYFLLHSTFFKGKVVDFWWVLLFFLSGLFKKSFFGWVQLH